MADSLVDNSTPNAVNYVPDAEIFGAAGEDGRPANVPEKYYTAISEEEDAPRSLDVNGVLSRMNHLESRLGAFSDAPPDGDYAATDLSDLVPEGSEYALAPDNPMVAWFLKAAREMGLGQAGVDTLMRGYAENEIQGLKEADQRGTDNREAEITKIHPENGQKMLDTMTQWVKNLVQAQGLNAEASGQVLRGYQAALATAEGYRFIEFLGQRIRGANLPSNESDIKEGMTAEDVIKLQNETYPDGHAKAGKRIYDNDPARQKEVRAAWVQVEGEGEKHTEVNFTRTS